MDVLNIAKLSKEDQEKLIELINKCRPNEKQNNLLNMCLPPPATQSAKNNLKQRTIDSWLLPISSKSTEESQKNISKNAMSPSVVEKLPELIHTSVFNDMLPSITNMIGNTRPFDLENSYTTDDDKDALKAIIADMMSTQSWKNNNDFSNPKFGGTNEENFHLNLFNSDSPIQIDFDVTNNQFSSSAPTFNESFQLPDLNENCIVLDSINSFEVHPQQEPSSENITAKNRTKRQNVIDPDRNTRSIYSLTTPHLTKQSTHVTESTINNIVLSKSSATNVGVANTSTIVPEKLHINEIVTNSRPKRSCSLKKDATVHKDVKIDEPLPFIENLAQRESKEFDTCTNNLQKNTQISDTLMKSDYMKTSKRQVSLNISKNNCISLSPDIIESLEECKTPADVAINADNKKKSTRTSLRNKKGIIQANQSKSTALNPETIESLEECKTPVEVTIIADIKNSTTLRSSCNKNGTIQASKSKTTLSPETIRNLEECKTAVEAVINAVKKTPKESKTQTRTSPRIKKGTIQASQSSGDKSVQSLVNQEFHFETNYICNVEKSINAAQEEGISVKPSPSNFDDISLNDAKHFPVCQKIKQKGRGLKRKNTLDLDVQILAEQGHLSSGRRCNTFDLNLNQIPVPGFESQTRKKKRTRSSSLEVSKNPEIGNPKNFELPLQSTICIPDSTSQNLFPNSISFGDLQPSDLSFVNHLPCDESISLNASIPLTITQTPTNDQANLDYVKPKSWLPLESLNHKADAYSILSKACSSVGLSEIEIFENTELQNMLKDCVDPMIFVGYQKCEDEQGKLNRVQPLVYVHPNKKELLHLLRKLDRSLTQG